MSIAAASVVLFGTLLMTGVIRPGMGGPCGGCAENEVCISGAAVTDKEGRPSAIRHTTPTCRATCDALRPSCPSGYKCMMVTGGGACFPENDPLGP